MIEPCEIPAASRVSVIADDLLAVIAIQMVEIDALRLQCSLPPFGPQRVFETKNLRNGRLLGPTAKFNDPDALVVRLES